MCLIAFKKSKLPLWDKKITKTAWDNNHDGFGLAYWGAGMSKVHILKGALTLPEAEEMIASIPDPRNKYVVAHWRTATAGKLAPGNCHPFPIAKKISLLTSIELDTPIAVAHNGCISDYSSGGHWDSATQKYVYGELSDTQQFIRDILTGLGASLWRSPVLTLIQRYTSSRWVFLGVGRWALLGTFTEDGGILYSNTGYKDTYTNLFCQQDDEYFTRYKFLKQGSKSPDTDYCDGCQVLTPTKDLTIQEDGSRVCPGCLRYFRATP